VGFAFALLLAAGCGGSGGTQGLPDWGTDVAPGEVLDAPAEVPAEVPADLPADLPGESGSDTPVEVPADIPDDLPKDDPGMTADAEPDAPANDLDSQDAPTEVLDVPLEYETCAEFLECSDACADNSCFQACWAGASDQARSDSQAFATCMDGQCPACPGSADCDSCRAAAMAGTCHEAAVTCDAIRSGTCHAAVGCMMACPDAVCGAACDDDMALEAGPLWQALGQCVMSYCTDIQGPEWTPCARTVTADASKCKTAFDACLAHKTIP